MKKEWYNIYMECINESAGVTAVLKETIHIGRIKSEGLAVITCKAIQESVGEYYKVYYK